LQQQTWSLSQAVTLELSLQQGDKAAGEMNCRWRGGSAITCQLLPRCSADPHVVGRTDCTSSGLSSSLGNSNRVTTQKYVSTAAVKCDSHMHSCQILRSHTATATTRAMAHCLTHSTNLNHFGEASSCSASGRLQCVGHMVRLKGERAHSREKTGWKTKKEMVRCSGQRC